MAPVSPPPLFFQLQDTQARWQDMAEIEPIPAFFFTRLFFLLVLVEPGSAFRITRACFNGIELSVDKALDVAQPPQVFPLLLDVDVVGHKHGHCLCDAPLLEESLH